MKRFVQEIANHVLKPLEDVEKHPEYIPIWKKVNDAVFYCERGMVTEIEAVKYIIQAAEEARDL